MLVDRIQSLVERLHTYPWWQVAIEMGIIWLVVFAVVRFVRGTRAAGALKGTLLLLIVATVLIRIIGQRESFQRLVFLYQNFLTLLAVTLIVVFQPELRRALIRLGEAPILRRTWATGTGTVEPVVQACVYLSKARFGAIMVIQRENKLKGLVEGGTAIHGRLSARLLQTIFFPGSALHDLAVVINGDQVIAAGVQLPLAEPDDMPDPALGSRHRAAVGTSRESDALVVVVSEETGRISLSERGRLEQDLTPDHLRDELAARLMRGSGTHAFAGDSMAAPGSNGTATRAGDGAHAHDEAHTVVSDPRD